MTGFDQQAVVAISRLVSEALADERVRRSATGRQPLDLTDERALARSVVARHLDALAARHLGEGRETLAAADESELADAVLARVLGLGRIQPLLEDRANPVHITEVLRAFGLEFGGGFPAFPNPPLPPIPVVNPSPTYLCMPNSP